MYTIYLHDDLDGTASAAVITFVLRQRGETVRDYIPVDYGQASPIETWKSFPLQKPAIIVDFLYHPDAAWWFDHHENPFRFSEWRENFQDDEEHAWNKNEPSACGMILRHFEKRGVVFPEHLKELAGLVDGADSAQYTTNAKYFADTPIRRIAVALGNFDDKGPEFKKYLITQFQDKSLVEALELPLTKERYLLGKEREDRVEAYYRQHLQVHGNTTLIDIDDDKLRKNHFLAYVLAPETVYSVNIKRLNPEGTLFHIGVGCNIEKKDQRNIHLGQFMQRYGGGGHDGIGATEARTKEEALRIANEIVDFLNANG